MDKKFKLQSAKGVRDFPPQEKILRDRILNTIKEVFELYGFNPIELPILERYDTLAAKFTAGEESDALKEIFVTQDNGKSIVNGNERVLNARLSDAKFFWENDLRVIETNGYESLAEKLKAVTFHNELGNEFNRVNRIST
ncbi:glycine--tRNA ligase subunit beta, partial [archaeon]|nr:glycine--tRNA ligase subunit beta [archaeon]